MENNLFEIIRRAETDYISGPVNIGKYTEFDMHDTIEKIGAYLNSQFTGSKTDSNGNDKPFFNIVVSAANIWYRATDLDRKDIRILPSTEDTTVQALLATVLLQDWMRRENFGVFLNEWGRVLSRYGSAVVKFVNKGGKLIPTVVPWDRLITDPIDFDALPRIERIYKTPVQLINMATKGHPDYIGLDLEQVEGLIESVSVRKTLDKQQKDKSNNFIELFEVHGEMSNATYLDIQGKPYTDEDKEIFFQQMHLISWSKNKEGKYDDFSLFSGKEAEDPYMITHLIKEDGRTLSIGAVEYLFDAQWMQNHTAKQTKDYLELASKLLFQTSDENFIGRNVLNNIQSGDIFIHKDNKPLTQISNTAQNITALQAFSAQWRVLSQELTSTPDALRGNTMPSGTPYSLGAILQQQAGSLFELMTENKGLQLEEMIRRFVIPFLKTKMNTSKEISAILNSQQIKEIDARYLPNQAIRAVNNKIKKIILSGGIATPEGQQADLADAQAQIQKGLQLQGNQRFFKPDEIPDKTWRESLQDLEWRVIVEITNEPQDKQALLTTLSTTFKDIVALVQQPQLMENPLVKTVLEKLLTLAGGISPLQVNSAVNPVPQAQPNPAPTS